MLKNPAVDRNLNEANVTQLCEYYLIAHQQIHDQIYVPVCWAVLL
jgi:hypothetical protein